MRRSLLMFTIAAVVGTMPGTSVGDTGGRRDPNDTTGRLDVRSFSHRHGSRYRDLVHVIETYGRWRSRRLGDCAQIEVLFQGARRRVKIKYRNGLRARISKWGQEGRDFVAVLPVWRPDDRSISFLVKRSQLGRGLERYRWFVSTHLVAGGCPTGPGDPPVYGDRAPNRGALLHDL